MRVWGATWMGLLSAVPPSWASACPGCAQVGVADAGRTLSVLGALAALPVALLLLGGVGLARALRHEVRGEGSHSATTLE